MILYIFLDGIGFGENDPNKNPFSKYAKSFFLPLAGKEIPENSIYKKGIYLKTDASMGIKGLPQSATGQTALWTGINAPQILNRHVSGYPSFTLKKIINEFSILKILNENGKKASFLNCYSTPYITKIQENARHVSASTLVQLATGQGLKNIEDLRNERGIFMDITHEIFREFAKSFLNPDDPLLEPRDPKKVGKIALQAARANDLSIYEYFLTDKVGHSMDWSFAEKVIYNVEEFLDSILESLDPERETLIISSDHGNLEDLTTKIHTENPVPTFLYGKFAKELSPEIKNLSDIPRAIYKVFNLEIDLYYPINKRED